MAKSKKTKKTPKSKVNAHALSRVRALHPSKESLDCYARSLVNPFDSDACSIPIFPSLPSRPIRNKYRASMTIGTLGVGFIALRPVASNNTNAVYFTGSTYNITTFATSGTGITAAPLNSLYSSTAFTSEKVAARLVSSGIRLRYAGTEANRGGIYWGCSRPDHTPWLAGATVADVGAFTASVSKVIDRNWFAITSVPVTRAELDYLPGTDLIGSEYNLIMVSSTAGNIFDFEIVANFELTGVDVLGKAPTAPADTSKFENFISTLQASSKDIGNRLANAAVNTLTSENVVAFVTAAATVPVLREARRAQLRYHDEL